VTFRNFERRMDMEKDIYAEAKNEYVTTKLWIRNLLGWGEGWGESKDLILIKRPTRPCKKSSFQDLRQSLTNLRERDPDDGQTFPSMRQSPLRELGA